MIERRVWIVQCLCGPNRHAIAALAGEFDSEDEAGAALVPQLRAAIAEMCDNGINRWCAICGAVQEGWRIEVGRTRFTTMKEAGPELARSSAENLLTNVLFGTHGSERPKRQ